MYPNLWLTIASYLAFFSIFAIFLNQAIYNTITVICWLFATFFLFKQKAFFKHFIQQYKIFYFLLIGYFALYLIINLYHLEPHDFGYAIQRVRWLIYAAVFIPFGTYLIQHQALAPYKNQYLIFYLLCVVLTCLIAYDSYTRVLLGEASTAAWFKSSVNNLASVRASWTYNPIPFSQLAFFCALLFYSIFCLCKKNWLSYSALYLSLAMLSIVVFSQTRSAWLAAITISPLLFIYTKKLRLFVPGSILFFIMVSNFFLDLDLTGRLISITEQTSSNTYRLEHWKANAKLSLDHPVMGVGYAQNRKKAVIDPYLYRFTEDENILYGHPHNEYLDISSGMGLLALLLFISIVGFPLRLAFKLIQPRTPHDRPRHLKPPDSPTQVLSELAYTLVGLAACYLIFVLIAAFFDKITLTVWSTIIVCWVVIFYYDYQLKCPKLVTNSLPNTSTK